MSDLKDFVRRGMAAQAAVDKLTSGEESRRSCPLDKSGLESAPGQAGKPQPVKGDWELGYGANGITGPTALAAIGPKGNVVTTPDIQQGVVVYNSVIAIIPDRPDAQQIADLIVAAPKLLATLKKLTVELLNHRDIRKVRASSAYRKAVALIAESERSASQ